MAIDGKIQTLHPGPDKKGVQIARDKDDAARAWKPVGQGKLGSRIDQFRQQLHTDRLAPAVFVQLWRPAR